MTENLNLLITASIQRCDGFLQKGKYVTEETSVCLSPIKISYLGDGIHLIAWGCSRGHKCINQKCRYAHAPSSF